MLHSSVWQTLLLLRCTCGSLPFTEQSKSSSHLCEANFAGPPCRLPFWNVACEAGKPHVMVIAATGIPAAGVVLLALTHSPSFAAGQGSIAEQLLVSHPNPRSMEDELSLDVGSPGGPVVQVPMPKGSSGPLEESTPLDACLAQLTSETAPSLRIPGSDGESFRFCAARFVSRRCLSQWCWCCCVMKHGS